MIQKINKKCFNLYLSVGKFSRQQIHYIFIFPQETIYMKCKSLFAGKNKNISKCLLLKFLPRVLSITFITFFVHIHINSCIQSQMDGNANSNKFWSDIRCLYFSCSFPLKMFYSWVPPNSEQFAQSDQSTLLTGKMILILHNDIYSKHTKCLHYCREADK